jgi:hypothetical protein
MSTATEHAHFEVKGHVLITDEKTGDVILDQYNAIHPQNMARIIARALANEDNGIIYRMAFGNGGTFIDAAGRIVFRRPNDGNNGAGWESRLYRETYSEIVDENDPNWKTDPGSAGPDNIRPGGGASPADDPAGGGVSSVEVSRNSNIITTVVLNENEPSGQLGSQSQPAPVLEEDENTFIFDEIGLYSPGLPAVNTSGISNVNIGNNKRSSNTVVPNLTAGDYAVRVTIDGVDRDAIITVSGTLDGSGPSGEYTYGDLCEFLNTNGTGGPSSWSISGFDFSAANGAFFFVTDDSGGTYPSIAGLESFGYFAVQSKTTGSSSTLVLPTAATILGDPNLFYFLASNVAGNININQEAGRDAGVINDSATPANERERLLSHLIFQPILKSASSILRITYTITVSVAATDDSDQGATVSSTT